MAPTTIYLPNGHHVVVTPVFGGLSFKASDLANHSTPFPPGWTVVLQTEDTDEDHKPFEGSNDNGAETSPQRQHHIHRFTKPSLRNDHMYISSISNPSSNEFKPAVSPTRAIAMMVWTTLWWYFHQPEPELQVTDSASSHTPLAGKPKGEWRITLNREGILRGRHLLPKLERMGLVTNEDPSVGVDTDDRTAPSWSNVYITRRHFWQLDARIFLFTLSPALNSPYPPGSPAHSRPSSPNRGSFAQDGFVSGSSTPPLGAQQNSWSTTDPFRSTSHLPTYFPPAPSSFEWTNGIRHPHRPKAPRQGEVFYTRYIPSLGETLSFRVPTLSRKPVQTSAKSPLIPSLRAIAGFGDNPAAPTAPVLSDLEYLHKWMNDDRVAASWGEQGPIEHQQKFLEDNLKLRHSFPVFGCFDDKPFGFFEIYWVKEDHLGAHLGGSIGNWDRGLHMLVGEQDFRGSHRVRVWLSALVHYCFLADMRTDAVVLEPRVDNDKLRKYCEDAGFFKEREVAFPHKQSNLMKTLRDSWEAPAL